MTYIYRFITWFKALGLPIVCQAESILLGCAFLKQNDL